MARLARSVQGVALGRVTAGDDAEVCTASTFCRVKYFFLEATTRFGVDDTVKRKAERGVISEVVT